MRSIGRVWRVSDGLASRACIGHGTTRHSFLSESVLIRVQVLRVFCLW
jgi:hypothetical protein